MTCLQYSSKHGYGNWDRLHEAVAVGEALAPQVQEELEELVEAELKATIERSARILKQTQREEK